MSNTKQTEEWEKESDYRLLRYAEVVGTKEAPEMRESIKSFIRTKKAEWEEKARKETIKEVLPKEKINLHEDYIQTNYEGFNSCRQQIIDNLKEKYNIKL
jgi:hypothetical protein